MLPIKRYTLFLLFIIFSGLVKAQSPGLIVRPPGGSGVTSLNPDGNGYSSATTAGFSSDDILESEIPFKVVAPAIGEPTGDVATGPSAGFTDIVTRVDGSGFYIYKDATNIYFRLRIGSIISGSKGYSVLIDTDGKMGGSGPYADPNYVAPSGSSPGNPGFEYEVSLQTNFQVAVYAIDGTATPGAPTTYSLNTNSQISVALSTDNNTPDYFYDWYVPLSAIGNPSSIRVAATTVTAPNSAFQGSRSDIYGINDANYANRAGAWQTVIDAQPTINLTSFTGVGATCTAAPTLSGPIATGTSITVSGNWTRLDASKPSTATITLYKNGVSVGTTTATSGVAWNISVASIANGDVFYARAASTGESQCLQSNNVIASSCITRPAAPVLTCASLKGISGTMPSHAAGNNVLVYLVPTTTANPTSTPLTPSPTYPTDGSFAYYTDGCSGGNNNVATGVYMIVTQNAAGCISQAAFVCVTSGSSGTPPALTTNALTLTTPIYATATSVSGTGAASGDILRLYINGIYQQSISATGSAFSFTGLTLNVGDQLKIYSQTGTACMTQSNSFTVSCFTAVPSINRNSSGNLLAGATSITGTSALPGASVQVYKGTAPSGTATGSAVTVASNGTWSVTVPALVASENYYATQTYNGCTSAASASASVLAPSACPTITNNYTDANTTVTGTMPSSFTGTIRLYQDGALIGSQSISAATTWSITVAAGTLYYNGILSATAQATGNTESSGCTTKTVGCTSPLTPSVSPTTTTITQGQTVNYTITNVASGNWYALLDNGGTSYATSTYRTTTSSFNITTNTFSTVGTYSLKLSADALAGCPASFSTVTVTVNAALPADFVHIQATDRNGSVAVVWDVTNEVDVATYIVERSVNGILFEPIGQLPFVQPMTDPNRYTFVDERIPTGVGTLHYKIRQVDLDGTYKYSKTVPVTLRRTDLLTLRVIPNPANARAALEIVCNEKTQAYIEVFDAIGRSCIRLPEAQLSRGINQVELPGVGSLPKGAYKIRMVTSSGTKTASLIKN